MKEIKKVTSDGEISMAEIRGGVVKEVCIEFTCGLQCSCQYADHDYQYTLAKGYYITHKDTWPLP